MIIDRHNFINRDEIQEKQVDVLSLRDKHNGKNCFILGRGHSIKDFDLKFIGSDNVVIAVNRAVVLADKVKIDYCIYTDAGFIDFLAGYKNENTKIIGHKDNLWYNADYYFETSLEYCEEGSSTMFYALQIALNVFSCSKIYLVGLDGYSEKGIIHFDDAEPVDYPVGQMERMIKDFEGFNWGSRRERIFNCNRKSLVRKFQFSDIGRDKKVLILGNGISRQEVEIKKFISEFDAERWACNYAYKEAIELKNISRITGHTKVLIAADLFREENKLNYEIYTNNSAISGLCPVKTFKCAPEWLRDAGTSFVVEAIVEGYKDIYLAGFDLGGKDIYAPLHETLNRVCWVNRWRQIRDTFGLDKLHFVGFDHKKFIMSNQSAGAYYKLYKNNKDHLVEN